MKQEHTFNGRNGNHIFERKYLGEKRYFQRGICKGISKGDEFVSFTDPQRVLKVDKILEIRDARGAFKNPEDAMDAAYQAELVDKAPINTLQGVYRPLMIL